MINNLQLKQIDYTYNGLDTIISLSIGNSTDQKVQQTIDGYKSVANHIIGSFVNEKLIGIIGFEFAAEQIIVKHIAVLSEYRSMGVGKELIKYIENNFIVNKIIAETDAESVGFYRALNFDCHAFYGPYGQRYKCIQHK